MRGDQDEKAYPHLIAAADKGLASANLTLHSAKLSTRERTKPNRANIWKKPFN